jgi:hypothetical protein
MVTRNTTTVREQYGEWYLPVSTNYNHNDYRFMWYSPSGVPNYCSTFTDFALYHTWPNGHDGGIGATAVKDQSASFCGNNYCNLIVNAGLIGSNGGFGDLWDVTGEAYQSKIVMYDIVCFYQ